MAMKNQFKGYAIEFKKSAAKAIRMLPNEIAQEINQKLEILVTNETHTLDVLKMIGHPDLFRLVVGKYRVVFQAIHHELVVFVVDAAHRKEVYRHF